MEFRKVVTNPVCETAKETQMYRTDFWTVLIFLILDSKLKIFYQRGKKNFCIQNINMTLNVPEINIL